MTTSTNTLKQEITQAGLKGTRARVALMEVLQGENRPLTAGEICAGLESLELLIDQATVYRILDIFTKKDLVTRYEFQEGKFRYELSGTEHHHLICEKCGRIDDFSDCNISELEKEIRSKKGFTTKRHSLEFYGVCPACQRKDAGFAGR